MGNQKKKKFKKFSGNPVKGLIKTSMKMFIYERERNFKNFVC